MSSKYHKTAKQTNRKNMKTIVFLTLGIFLFSCNQNNSKAKTSSQQAENNAIVETSVKQAENEQEIYSLEDREEIQNLIREALKWADSKNGINILPMLKDDQNGIYTGLDLNALKANLKELRATGFFASEFIENYNQIISTLDEKLRNREFEEWLTGELPPFNFANGVNPWCNCQDTPYDHPNPWEYIEIVGPINNKADLAWKWSGLNSDIDSGWKEFSYRFRVEKENGKWRIAYLQGFDFEQSTRSPSQADS